MRFAFLILGVLLDGRILQLPKLGLLILTLRLRHAHASSCIRMNLVGQSLLYQLILEPACLLF